MDTLTSVFVHNSKVYFHFEDSSVFLHFVIHNILTRYLIDNFFLTSVFGSCSVFCWQGMVSFILSYGKVFLEYLHWKSQMQLYDFFGSLQLPHVFVNCVEYFTSRLLLEEVLIQLQSCSGTEQTSPVRCDTLNDFVRLFKQAVASQELQDQTLYIVSNSVCMSSPIPAKRVWVMAIDNLDVKCVPYRAVCTKFLQRPHLKSVDGFFLLIYRL